LVDVRGRRRGGLIGRLRVGLASAVGRRTGERASHPVHAAESGRTSRPVHAPESVTDAGSRIDAATRIDAARRRLQETIPPRED
jgi:hypothetical protein